MQPAELNPPPLDNRSKTIQLDYPIMANGMLIDNITIRRPLVRDLLIAERSPGGEAQKEIILLANLAEISPNDVECMDLSDYHKCLECLADFLS